MWYRDWDTARREGAVRERDLRQRVLAEAALQGSPAERRRRPVRAFTAAAFRRLGRATLALSNRIDACGTAADPAARRPAYR